ncbi:MAG: hypothetical protein WEA09_11145 [Gemmatimonadota bacterium]
MTRMAYLFPSLLLALTVPVSPLSGQQEGGDEARFQLLMVEYESAQTRLQEVQEQTLEAHPELLDKQGSLQELVVTAMAEIDPQAEEGIARLETLQAEAQEAQASQDGARMQELMAEASTIQERLQGAQAQALEREDVAEAINDFQEAMLDGMKAVEPEVEAIVTRLQELTDELMQLQTQLQGGPGGR